MLDALRTSTEPSDIREKARGFLRGVIGDLVRRKVTARSRPTGRGRDIRDILPALKGAIQQAPQAMM